MSCDCEERDMGDAREQWAFLDPPNTAVLANTTFWEGDGWIQRVTHDSEDGAWQFLPLSGASM
jgi:hypothetical protein